MKKEEKSAITHILSVNMLPLWGKFNTRLNSLVWPIPSRMELFSITIMFNRASKQYEVLIRMDCAAAVEVATGDEDNILSFYSW